jgi:hypothetical protein
VWSKEIATDEKEMCYSLANMEHHHGRAQAVNTGGTMAALRCTAVLCAIVMIAVPNGSSAFAQDNDTRATVGSVSGEVGLGLVSGLAGAITGAAIGTTLGKVIRGKWVKTHDDEIDPFVGIAALAGNAGGSALGVYLAGRRAQVIESVWWTLGGAVIGEAVAVGSVYYIEKKARGNDSALLPKYVVLFVAPTIGATIAFNASRHRTTVPIAMNLHF